MHFIIMSIFELVKNYVPIPHYKFKFGKNRKILGRHIIVHILLFIIIQLIISKLKC